VVVLESSDLKAKLGFIAPGNILIECEEAVINTRVKKKESNVMESISNELEFKPSDTPYLRYGKDVLNNNIDWRTLTLQILEHGYSIEHIADELNVRKNIIEQVLSNNYSRLNFKSGAKLCSIHFRHYSGEHE
jgi:DNA-binding NarL/FixJ family response regulator